MADLKTDYKDDVLDTEVNELRKYQMIQNEDGTVSFVDVTEYLQVGDSFGSVDVNAITERLTDIGTVSKKELSSAKATTTGSWNDILSLELPAGTYLITGSIYTSATLSEGIHHLLLSSSSSSTTFDNSKYQPSGRVGMQVHEIVTVATETTFYLKYLHTVETGVTVSKNANTNITAVRIK